ncbi:MAG: BLUF domain-containing protein, partial [Alphaproteobacteria bacterium]|nr:BLUF domain-containing protein [Alphaproteobacteria bacterium]
YVSHCPRELASGELNDILVAARANNALLGISGLLLHIDGGFLQMLEGDERAVRELYARIAVDRRHQDPRIMLDREIPTRVFSDWSMGYECPNLNDPETAGMFGVVRAAVHDQLSPGTGRIVAMMLQTFYRVQNSDLPVNLYYAG